MPLTLKFRYLRNDKLLDALVFLCKIFCRTFIRLFEYKFQLKICRCEQQSEIFNLLLVNLLFSLL